MCVRLLGRDLSGAHYICIVTSRKESEHLITDVDEAALYLMGLIIIISGFGQVVTKVTTISEGLLKIVYQQIQPSR